MQPFIHISFIHYNIPIHLLPNLRQFSPAHCSTPLQATPIASPYFHHPNHAFWRIPMPLHANCLRLLCIKWFGQFCRPSSHPGLELARWPLTLKCLDNHCTFFGLSFSRFIGWSCAIFPLGSVSNLDSRISPYLLFIAFLYAFCTKSSQYVWRME